jgi:hypothetical protein
MSDGRICTSTPTTRETLQMTSGKLRTLSASEEIIGSMEIPACDLQSCRLFWVVVRWKDRGLGKGEGEARGYKKLAFLAER